MAEVKLLVNGTINPAVPASDLELNLPSGVHVTRKANVDVLAARADAVPKVLSADEDDLVEIELADGIKLWTSVRQLREDEGRLGTRAAADGVFELPTTIGIRSASRGAADWVIKGLRILGVDIAGEITDFISSHVEGKLLPGPGLYRCNGANVRDLSSVNAQQVAANRPILVFLHGTASSTEGSFGGLWGGGAESAISKLVSAHEGQVYAFQHRTLTLSPIENALDLVNNLPKGARLHLVSHSRGGLIGELLCRSMREGGNAFDDTDFKLFADPGRQRDLTALRELARAMDRKRIRVERFVRVACPARGTTLADGRLDRYLSIVLNLLSYVGLKGNPVYQGMSALLAAVVRKRTEPAELPGIEAMMPISPLVALLNRIDVSTAADLHVLGGDIQGGSMLERLKVLATDIYYREDHDLVVNTPSMFGGAQRAKPVRYWIDEGSQVSHFNYFKNLDTANRVVEALSATESDGFHVVEKMPSEITEADYRKRAVGPEPVVFVLPGIMGTNLTVGNDRIWMDLFSLARGGMGKIAIDKANVMPDGPVTSGYGNLLKFLAATHEVIPFGYDWRLSIDKAARRLLDAVDAKLKETESSRQPIRIIAHSMGGLVARTMLALPEGKKVWERMRQRPGCRFVMLGTPNGGSHSIAAMLMGRDSLVTKLSMLDLSRNYTKLLQIICGFPGALQLLPFPETGALDLLSTASWEKIRSLDVETRGLFSSTPDPGKSSGVSWGIPEKALLDEANALHQLWRNNPLDPAHVVYVAGTSPATPINILLREEERPGRRVYVEATTSGDGRVPWATGIPPELKGREYYMNATHGDMASKKEYFQALFDLLTTGVTNRLPQTPPVRRGGPERFELPVEMPAMFPDQQDLEASALGGTTQRPTQKEQPKVRIKVVHGDLSSATSPVIVGHYIGDSIVSAEAYLDRCLRGRLRQRHELGLYPGPVQSAEVFLDQCGAVRKGHPGAIIVGLGAFGDLSPGELTSAISVGALKYATEKLDEMQDGNASKTNSLALTTLLIGTGSGGFGVGDSLHAILRGILRANGRLSLELTPTAPRGDIPGSETQKARPRITELTIIELYEDRAIQAARALADLSELTEFRDNFEMELVLKSGSGGLKRVVFEEANAWWQRIRISTQEEGLKFEVFTDRARTESFAQPNQRKLVDSFLADAISSTATDVDLGSTLFEVFVPNRIKDMAPDNRDLVLLLDENSAAYPWELMRNRWDPEGRPLAVKSGMIRQLSVPVFRERATAALENVALVVGDPLNSDPRFRPLPGAQEEARQVAAELRSAGYVTQSLIASEATPRSVLTALHGARYRILHLAAHGVVDFDLDGASGTASSSNSRKKVTGMTIGDGVFLDSEQINQMRNVPEFVFLNCCHLGQTRNEVPYHQLAANVATQLIRMGVRAVIAAGWPVDDNAAQTFALVFYRRFLGGAPFGQAVREARLGAFEAYSHSNTWGAYQCYGDPGFFLKSGGANEAARKCAPLADSEIRVELENFALQCSTDRTSTNERSEWLRRKADGLPMPSLRSGSIQAALGRAYAESGDLENAVKHYAVAKQLQDAQAPIKVVEQLANLRARLANQIFDQNPKEAKKLFELAADDIELLIKLGETPERLNLSGSLYKRRAMCSSSQREALSFIRKSAQSYQRAYQLATNPGSLNYDPDSYYPLQNWISAEIPILWSQKGKKPGEELEKGLSALEKFGETLGSVSPDAWTLLLPAEIGVLKALIQPSLPSAKSIAEMYSDAQRRAGSNLTWNSSLNQLKFFKKMAGSLQPKNTKLHGWLEELQTLLS